MAVRQLLHWLAAVAAIALSSCVYPFEPEITGTDSRIVVEGSISVGGTSTFYFSRMIPMSGVSYWDPRAMEMSGYIEGEDGTRVGSSYGGWEDASLSLVDTKTYTAGDSSSSRPTRYMLLFDTSQLNPAQRCRAHFEDRETGAVYESDWVDVCAAPVIDELRYILDPVRSELNVALSMHSATDSHFRCSFDETWEYHSDLYASHYLEVSGDEMYLIKFSGGQNNYYCWDSFRSPEVKLFSSSEQVENRFTDLEFYRISSSNRKLQVLYRLTLHLEAVSEEAFRYWKNIEDNTNNQGSLFSPIPSQMRGNIHCLSDPFADVVGYVSAAVVADGVMYYDDLQEKFYNGPDTDWSRIVIEEITDPAMFYLWRFKGYLPYTVIPADMSENGQTTWQWAKAECVDCRRLGGTKTKPAGWPNDHK